jgi:SRSO17 transposase
MSPQAKEVVMAIPKAGPSPLAELGAFLEPFGRLVRRSESREAMERYATGLLSDLSRKTASDMGRSIPGTNGQRLQEFLTNTPWSSEAMDEMRIRFMTERASVGDGVVVIDDTGLPKKGRGSVGVGRQYSGTLGRVDNCQVVVTTHYVDRVFDWPINARLYLPRPWTEDGERREKARIPENVEFETKGLIGLRLLDQARAAGLKPRAVVADAGYGDQPPFVGGLEARNMPYLVAVGSAQHFRSAEAVFQDEGDVLQPPYQGKGRPRKSITLEDRISTQTTAELLEALPEEAWHTVAWREGTRGALVKRATRIRVFRSGLRGSHLPSEGWLVGERPLPGRQGDPKFYLAWGLDALSLEELLELAHVRWVIERFYQDAKGELGFDDYEGRLWPGLHRHLALVMVAHSFLTLKQSYGPEITGPPDPIPDSATSATSTPPARGFPPKSPKKHRRTAKVRP